MKEKIRNEYREEIETLFPKIPRRVSGYNLDELVKDGPVNLSKIIAGSEGTLGVVTEIKMRIVRVPKVTGLCVVHCDDMISGMRAVGEMLTFHPISIEMIDKNIIEMGKHSPSVCDKLNWLVGDPKAVFAIELEADTDEELLKSLQRMEGVLRKKKIGFAHVILTDSETMSHIWQVRKAGLGLLMSKRSYSRAVAFIEDVAVAPESLADFIMEYQKYMKGIGKESGIYGHVGSGCMHIRPYSENDNKLMEQIMQNVTQMLIEHGGTLSGEHGDGIVRSWLNEKLFGKKIYQAFVKLKQVLDPDNRMNPGKIVFPEPFESNRRVDPKTPIHEIETFQDFSKEGGFALAVDMCNGNAQCRKPEGTMCPSFHASNDEYHTTRARAQMLRAVTTGRLPIEEFTGEGLRDVLDLCVECKGCKKECPSQVDMAKMKAEFLYHYQEKHGYSFRDRIFAFIGTVDNLASPFSSIANAMSSNYFSRKIQSLIGIAPERELPLLARTRFSRWVKKHRALSKKSKKVVLFNDTFTEFHEPQVGIAAMHILEALGYYVIVPKWQCCGRTLISKGFLRQAKQYAETLVSTLKTFAEENIPIVGLEPSCLLTIKDDFQGLLGYDNIILQKILPHCYTLDEFLAQQICSGELPIALKNVSQQIVYHGHCHQKALVGTSQSLEVLQCLPNTFVTEIPTGCCGMAGSFGYEKEHYDFSVKIAEQQLLPGLKNVPPDATVIANGFSCRHQIQHLTTHKPLHLAEVFYASLLK